MAVSLLSLPSEVIYLIFEYFTLDRIKYVEKWIFDRDWKLAVLRRASLVCRQMNSIVTPLLWRHLFVSTSRDYATLLHALLYKPYLRAYACSFVWLFEIGEKNDGNYLAHWRFNSCQARYIATKELPLSLDERAKEVLRRSGINYDEASEIVSPGSEFATRTIASILLLLPSLKDVVMRVPRHGEGRLRCSEILYEAIGGQEPSWGPALGSIRSLRLQCGSLLCCRPYLHRGFQPGLVEQLFMAPNLKAVEFHGDVEFNADSDVPYPSRNQPLPRELISRFSQIEYLRLSEYYKSPGTIKLLLDKCTSLTSLYWTFSQSRWPSRETHDIKQTSLDNALAQVSKTLRHLHLESHFLGKGLECVRSLSKFSCLESLFIDLTLLAGGSNRFRRFNPSILDLAAVLPPNLVKLELIGDINFTTPYERCRSSGVLRCFAQSCAASQPHLKSFIVRDTTRHRQVIYKTPNSDSSREYDSRAGDAVKQITKLFKTVGVKFVWEWIPNQNGYERPQYLGVIKSRRVHGTRDTSVCIRDIFPGMPYS